jgi:hypothetical protein
MNNSILFIICIVCIVLIGIFLHQHFIVKEPFISTLNKHINKQKRNIRLQRNYLHNKYIKPIQHLVKKKLFR